MEQLRLHRLVLFCRRNSCTFSVSRAQIIELVHISGELCANRWTCAHFRKVVHKSLNLCTFQESCAQIVELVRISVKLCINRWTCAHFSKVVHKSRNSSVFPSTCLQIVELVCISFNLSAFSSKIACDPHVLIAIFVRSTCLYYTC